VYIVPGGSKLMEITSKVEKGLCVYGIVWGF